jgi:hypothetical protein
MSTKRVNGKLKRIGRASVKTGRRRREREEPRTKQGPLAPSGINADAAERERRMNRAGWKARLDKRMKENQQRAEEYNATRAAARHAEKLAEAEEFIKQHQADIKKAKGVVE